MLLGCLAFGALGILLGGTLRAEITLAVANVVWFVLLLAGGIVVPLAQLPGPLAAVGALLPSGALAEGLRTALTAGQPPAAAPGARAARLGGGRRRRGPPHGQAPLIRGCGQRAVVHSLSERPLPVAVTGDDRPMTRTSPVRLRRQLRAAGYPDHEVTRLARAGALTAVRRGPISR